VDEAAVTSVQKRKPPTPMEAQAARIVAACTDSILEPLDPGGGARQLPDYEIQDRPGHRVGVLEVTSTILGDLAAFVSDRNKIGQIQDSRLVASWFLTTRSADIRFPPLRKVLPDLIFALQESGYLPPPTPEVLIPDFTFALGDEPWTALYRAGIGMIAGVLTSMTPGFIYVKPPAIGGAIGPSQVTEAVQAALELPDNLAKLATAAPGERSELFVWLADSHAANAMDASTVFVAKGIGSAFPTDGPTLPAQVTKVWAATGWNDGPVLARALWMAEAGIWQVLPPPPRLDWK